MLSKLADRHQLFKKLNELDKITGVVSQEEFQLHMSRWDVELTDFMKAAENMCRPSNIQSWNIV